MSQSISPYGIGYLLFMLNYYSRCNQIINHVFIILRKLQTLKTFVIQKFTTQKNIYHNNKMEKKHKQHSYQYVGEIAHTNKRSI